MRPAEAFQPGRWQALVETSLRQQSSQGLLRQRRILGGACGPRRLIDRRELLTFSSNDYLGLAADERVCHALASAAGTHGAGAGSAQLLGGYGPLHEKLERALANWVHAESAVVFSTGYMANLGLISALADRATVILQDKLNHASLLDAARLSRGTLRRYAHLDPQALERRLDATDARCLVATESLFSMDGDIAPLASISALCAQHDALLCVDEAHALGVRGEGGAGLMSEARVAGGPDPRGTIVITGTLGKSLGTFGAFVAGPHWLTRYLVSAARSHIYTTAPPPALAAASLIALELCQREDWRRQRLADGIARFRAGAARLGIGISDSQTPIQPLVIGQSGEAMRISAALETRGVWVPAIRPPTVPEGTARLRVSITAAHAPEDIDQLLDALAAVL